MAQQPTCLLDRARHHHLTAEYGQQLLSGQTIEVFRVGPDERTYVNTVHKPMLVHFCGSTAINGYVRVDDDQTEVLEIPAKLCENEGLYSVFDWMQKTCLNPRAALELRGPETNLVTSCSIARAMWALGCEVDARRMDRWISRQFFARPLNAGVIQALWYGLSSQGCMYHQWAATNHWRSLDDRWMGFRLPKQFKANLGRLMRRIPDLGQYLQTLRRTSANCQPSPMLGYPAYVQREGYTSSSAFAGRNQGTRSVLDPFASTFVPAATVTATAPGRSTADVFHPQGQNLAAELSHAAQRYFAPAQPVTEQPPSPRNSHAFEETPRLQSNPGNATYNQNNQMIPMPQGTVPTSSNNLVPGDDSTTWNTSPTWNTPGPWNPPRNTINYTNHLPRPEEVRRIESLFAGSGWGCPYPEGTVGHRLWGPFLNIQAFMNESDFEPVDESDA